jgi:hypothetical protein
LHGASTESVVCKIGSLCRLLKQNLSQLLLVLNLCFSTTDFCWTLGSMFVCQCFCRLTTREQKSGQHVIGVLRNVDIQQYFLRDLKEDGIIKTQWIPTLENSADLFTKNLYGPLFEKHIRTYVGIDMYMEREDMNETDEWTLVRKTGNRKLKPRFDRNNARGESAGNVRQGLGLRARHPNCPWNGQLESLDNIWSPLW